MYLVTEVQDNGEHVGTLNYEFETYEDAEARYHAILSAAAKSTVRCHGAVLLYNSRVLAGEGFDHIIEME